MKDDEQIPDNPPLSEEEKRSLVEAFEANGFATFILGVEKEGFDTVMDYVRKNQVPTLTDVDEATGTVTITRRPFGSLEFG